jgi:RNA polymerase sigma-70 factor, ECF subfamily
MKEEQSDEALMRQYRDEGDVQAFETLVRRHRRPIYNFIVRFVGAGDKAEDLLQDVFVKLASRADDYAGRAKVRTWLYTIARNLSVDELRRARHRNAVSLDGVAGGDGEGAPLVERIPGAEALPDRAADSARLGPILVEAIAALPEDQREVFLLREYSGVPFKEIAEITGAGLNTVKSRMRYALEGLRKSLEARGIVAEPDTSGAGATDTEAVGT